MICNLVANPNIGYLILGGPESKGHATGAALKALMLNGVDARKRIVGVEAPHAALFNLPGAIIERFRKQVTLIDLQFEGDPDVIRQAVQACYQEEPMTSEAIRCMTWGRILSRRSTARLRGGSRNPGPNPKTRMSATPSRKRKP